MEFHRIKNVLCKKKKTKAYRANGETALPSPVTMIQYETKSHGLTS